MQQVRICHLGKIEFSDNLETTGKNAQLKILVFELLNFQTWTWNFKSEVKVILFLWKK